MPSSSSSRKRFHLLVVLGCLPAVNACSNDDTTSVDTTETAIAATTVLDTVERVPSTETTVDDDLPTIMSVTTADASVPAYGRFDLEIELDADYANPYDQREVALDATFLAPDGAVQQVPGFWDDDDGWAFRFTPSAAGDWTYSITATDTRGTSDPMEGSFTVTASDAPGFIRPGDWVDPALSPHYFSYDDGTPWFGFGHADLGMSWDGFSGDTFKKMSQMAATGENLEMWWPTWAMNPLQNAYDDYHAAAVDTIDLVVDEAEQNGISIAYTIWIHQHLRTRDHAWGTSEWNKNGFSKLVDDPQEFFVDDESWAWQENYYRYTIARWAYSPAIAMWQTITEINGTESYDQTDPWHERLNAYFQEHDPYRHPTTATKSGGEYWPAAYEVMDVPQMHVYEQFHANPVEAAEIMATWTRMMWDAEDKPNWIGEYGDRLQPVYPEFFHNSTWASIAAGAATTPFEWNDKLAYGNFDDEMQADMLRITEFVETIPLVEIDPGQLDIVSSDPAVRGWGVAGAEGGLIWVQDFTFESTGAPEDLDAIRSRPPRDDVTISLVGLSDGSYTATPYETWTGEWLDEIAFECSWPSPCNVALPMFTHDIALALSAG